MRITKSGKEIQSVEDWFTYAPPKMGQLHWKDGRSAKELAKAWFRGPSASAPDELRQLLENRFGSPVEIIEAKPECIIELDDFQGEHRNCDLVVLCKTAAQTIAVNVEAKADEPFGDLTGEYLDRTLNSRSNVPERIRSLSQALFGREPDALIRNLRYQLIHAAAASLIEAKNLGADVAVFLVHEFRSQNLDEKRLSQNHTDWEAFVRAFPELATSELAENTILGPVSVAGGGRVPNSVPLYLGKLVTELT